MAQQWNTKKYIVELGAAMLVYAVLLVASNVLERRLQPEGVLLVALNLMPILGVLAAAWAIVRAFFRMDELQRRIQFEALVLAFAGTAVITFSWGFVEDMGVPHLRAFMVWPIMAMLWIAGLAIATWRYHR